MLFGLLKNCDTRLKLKELEAMRVQAVALLGVSIVVVQQLRTITYIGYALSSTDKIFFIEFAV